MKYWYIGRKVGTDDDDDDDDEEEERMKDEVEGRRERGEIRAAR